MGRCFSNAEYIIIMKKKSGRGGFREGSGRKPIIGYCFECINKGITSETNLTKGRCNKHYGTYRSQQRRYKKTGKESPKEVMAKVLNGDSFVDEVWAYFVQRSGIKGSRYVGMEGRYYPSLEEFIVREKLTLENMTRYIDYLFSKDCWLTDQKQNIRPDHLYSGREYTAYEDKAGEEQVVDNGIKIIDIFSDDLVHHILGYPPDADVVLGHKPKTILYSKDWDVTHLAIYLASATFQRDASPSEIKIKAIDLYPDINSLYNQFKEFYEEKVTDKVERTKYNLIFKNYLDACFERAMPLRMILSLKTARNAWVDYLPGRLEMMMEDHEREQNYL